MEVTRAPTLHTWTWLAWLLASLAALSLTRNPLYLMLIFLSIGLVHSAVQNIGSKVEMPVSPLKLALFILPATALFNSLTSHYGATVLFTIPGQVPLLSGAVTGEALVFGVTNGLVLSTMLAAFMTFSQALPTGAFIYLIPRAYASLAVVVTISISFMPIMRRQFMQIREAQAIRGHHLRGLKDWLPLLMPLLIGGLERAIQLAEAMTARGFAQSHTTPARAGARLALLSGLALLYLGWLGSLTPQRQALGAIGMLGGTVIIIVSLWRISRKTAHTTYRRETWRVQDWIVLTGGALVCLAFLLPLPPFDHASLAYNSYPALQFPPFDPLTGIAIIGLLGPAVAMLLRSEKQPPI